MSTAHTSGGDTQGLIREMLKKNNKAIMVSGIKMRTICRPGRVGSLGASCWREEEGLQPEMLEGGPGPPASAPVTPEGRQCLQEVQARCSRGHRGDSCCQAGLAEARARRMLSKKGGVLCLGTVPRGLEVRTRWGKCAFCLMCL